MEKLKEQRQTFQDLESLIYKMEEEINNLRAITYRYHLMYGDKLKNGSLFIPDNLSFNLSEEKDGEVKCRMIDHDKINFESNYQLIKKMLKKLM